MSTILDSFLQTISAELDKGPDRLVQDIGSSIGSKQALLKTTGAFGGTLTQLATPEPRKRYNFQVKLGSSGLSKSIEANVKSISRPKLHLDYRTVRYMNTVRKTLRSITFEPVTLTIYDDLAGSVQRDIERLIFGKATHSVADGMILGHSIDMKSFRDTIIDEVVIHSATAPLVQLFKYGIESLGRIMEGRTPESIASMLTNSGVQHMKLLNCTIDSIDFGEFDYTISESNEVTITLSYQAIQFGSSTESGTALEIFGGIGAKILTGGF